MGYTNSGLSNNGRTQYFNFLYDDSLSSARGKELANELMKYCDNDFLLVSTWFTGDSVNTPINIIIEQIHDIHDAGSPWFFEVALKIGEFQVIHTTPAILLRYFIVVDTSQIFMRFKGIPNYWFGAFNEGSKGCALSHFLGIQFLINKGVKAIPEVIGTTDATNSQVSFRWLNSSRKNFIDINIDDNSFNDVTGCATLFLFYLHVHLHFSIKDIIKAGGETLADVYSTLTGNSKSTAWNSFRDLVNLHCPQDGSKYFPPLDNIFPVSDLDFITAPEVVSWVANGNSNDVGLFITHATTIDIKISLASDNSTLIEIDQKALIPSQHGFTYKNLRVRTQNSSFIEQVVNITASYAGRTLSKAIKVVSPENLILPELEIEPITSKHPCESIFVQGTSMNFKIKNLNVIYDHSGLIYEWSVSGAVIQKSNSEVLSIPLLPVAGTKVIINVTVTNAHKIHAKGTCEFFTRSTNDLYEMAREVRCRLSNIKSINLHIPPWVPVEKTLTKKQLVTIKNQSKQLIIEAKKVITTVAKIQSFKTKT